MGSSWLDTRDAQQLDSFRKYLKDTILPLAVPEKGDERDEIEQYLLSGAVMGMWVSAFTLENYDAQFNLEYLEFVGDNAAGYVFALAIKREFPDIDQEKATLLKNHYLKDEIQAEWGSRLRVRDHIWTYIEPTFKDVEDVFESMFGVFATAGELYTPGLGGLLIANFMDSYLKTLTIDLANVRKDAKTAIKEYFDGTRGWVRHPWKPSDMVRRVQRGNVEALQFFLPDRAVAEIAAQENLVRADIPVPFVEVTVPRGTKKDVVAFRAAAVKLLDDYHINVYVEPDYGSFASSAEARGKDEGFSSLSLHKIERKEQQKTYYQMIGAKDGKQQILAALFVGRAVGVADAKKFLSDLYTKNGADPRPYSIKKDDKVFHPHIYARS